MPSLDQLLQANHVRCKVDLPSRKRALQFIAETLADEVTDDEALFDALLNRERLGSTGLGEGVAIPHCRLDCSALRVAFVTLKEAVDYEAADGQPVDLLFALVVPNDEQQAHLEALAVLADLFGQAANRDALRGCHSDAELLRCIRQLLNAGQPASRHA